MVAYDSKEHDPRKLSSFFRLFAVARDVHGRWRARVLEFPFCLSGDRCVKVAVSLGVFKALEPEFQSTKRHDNGNYPLISIFHASVFQHLNRFLL